MEILYARHQAFFACLVLSYIFHNNLAAYLWEDFQNLQKKLHKWKIFVEDCEKW